MWIVLLKADKLLKSSRVRHGDSKIQLQLQENGGGSPRQLGGEKWSVAYAALWMTKNKSSKLSSVEFESQKCHKQSIFQLLFYSLPCCMHCITWNLMNGQLVISMAVQGSLPVCQLKAHSLVQLIHKIWQVWWMPVISLRTYSFMIIPILVQS